MKNLNLKTILCGIGIWLIAANLFSQTATINMSDQKQIVRGFGASNVILWRPDMTSAEVEAAFGNDDGEIGFSILRIMLEADPSRWSLYVSTCQQAQSLGATIIASAWHAPDDMTETVNGEIRIKDDMYDDYAEHLNDFVTYMSNNGVTIYGISVQNEPDIGEWTQWTPDEMLTFMRDYAHLITGTKVMAPESYHFNRDYSDPILNNSTATANTDIICGHIYGGGLESYPLAEEKGKEVWMTEYLTGWEHSSNTWEYAFEVSKQIHDVMSVGWNAYVWWNVVRYYGPIADGESYEDNPNEDYGDKGEVTKKGYIMSQYSKFVRPGYYRIEATENPTYNVYLTAYKKDESVVIVAINQSTVSKTLTLALENGSVSSYTKYTTSSSKNVQNEGTVSVSDGSCTITLEPESVTTFVSSGTGDGGGDEDTYYTITNRNSSKVLDVSGSSSSDNADIIQYTGNSGTNQQWQFIDAGSGYYYIKARHSGKCIRALNGNAIQYTFNTGYWSEMFEKVDAGDGYFLLKNRSTNTCLRVEDSSGSNGASIILDECNTGWWSEQFSITSLKSAQLLTEKPVEELSEQFTIYPTLASQTINIELPVEYENSAQVSIYSSTGVLVSKKVLNQAKLDVSMLNKGLYLMVIQNGNKTYTRKFIKE